MTLLRICTDTALLARQPPAAADASRTREDYPPALRASLERLFGEPITPAAAVARIVADVRARGDAALREWTNRIDGVNLKSVSVQSVHSVDEELADALAFAADRIKAFHAQQPIHSWMTPDGALGQRVTPLNRVGIYVPGGSAPLPSSLLMSAIPAQVAGVKEIIVCTPPGRPAGDVPPVILAAAHICGVDRIYRLGGAQAIAAMAFGTESVPRVDKIVGPGNLFVTLAKRQVFGLVGLDGLAGPTETLVVADGSANPAWVAADLLAQAEHDPLATAILLTPSRPLAEAVQVEAARQIESLTRADIIAQSLADRGGIVLTPDLATAVHLANEFAPEHLCLSVEHPEQWLSQITNAGGLFVGEQSFEVLGDYVAGPSHVMPTGGTARFASPLSVWDFVRITNVISLDSAAAAALSPIAAALARAESLDAHAKAASLRIQKPEFRSQNAQGANRLLTSDFSHRPPAPMNIASLIRPDIITMEAYTPIVPFDVLSARLGRAAADIVKLDANENPYGPSPRVREALAQLQFAHIYPDPQSTALRAALSRRLDVPAENILAGAGADELIDLILRLFIQPGDAIVDCPPTFGMYSFDAAVNGGRLIQIPRRNDFSLDVEAIAARWRSAPRLPKLVFLASPNNPDGGVISDDDLRRLLAMPLVVVLDEAYVEFAGERASRIGWVMEHDNLIVLRTFSKCAGLAGLRVGYGVFPAALMPHLWKIKQPYNVSVAASAAALASLADGDYMEQVVARLAAEREQLAARLSELPFLRVYPSRANFVLCRVVGRDARALKRALERRGILVRYFDRPGLADCLRISAGRPEHTEALMAALKALTSSIL